jgi:hypothetical protein
MEATLRITSDLLQKILEEYFRGDKGRFRVHERA